MKIKDVTLNNLKVLLQSIPRENLYHEDIKSVENKWQALTLRSKIVGLIKEANKAFDDKIEKADGILAKFREEHKLLASQYEFEGKDEKPEDKKNRLKEKAKAEKELNERIDVQVAKESGLKLYWYQLGAGQAAFPKYAEDAAVSAVSVEMKFDDKHKHTQFIREQIETNMFEMRVEDSMLSELHEAFNE